MMGNLQKLISGTTWTLESFQSQGKNGEIVYPLGKEAEGIIAFTPEQIISVHIMAGEDQSVDKGNFLTYAEEQMAELGYHAYAGKYQIDEAAETLDTHVAVSLLSSYAGTHQVRSVKLADGKLHLSNVQHPERKLVWKKVE